MTSVEPEPGAFVHTIRVTWGDCDPARIAYTGRLPWFALDAIDAWWDRHLGHGWYELELDRDVGTPFVHMAMDFRAPVTPRYPLECEVWPSRLGETSIEFRVAARQNDTLCFEGRFVCVFIEASRFAKQKPPRDILNIVNEQIRAGE
ncbi:MAG TPA: acyl-CoA thioesterase [Rhabdaerophilum sp.]|nr:acyl-CoA thioesterase [Rhabdaerophilum sp.]